MSLSNVKVLTFDVIGTLIDYETGILDYVRRHAQRPADELDDDRILKAYLDAHDQHGGRYSEAMAGVYHSMARLLDVFDSDAVADGFQLSVLRWPAFPDSAAALARLRRRFRLVAMTNGDRVALSAFAHTLGDPFDDSVTFDETGVAKPDPQFFAYNRGRQSAFGFKMRDILHVAQSQHHDIGIAHALGYKTCWIERRQGRPGWGASTVPAQVTRPDFHFATLAQLADAVDAAQTS